MNDEVEHLLAESHPVVRLLMEDIYDFFVGSAGCTAYVKTIYVGFDLCGTMVAAAYPHASSIDVALALPDEIGAPGLFDAAHLTWRTMPVAVEVSNQVQLKAAGTYFENAVERVRTGAHDVELPQERFMGRKRRIAHPKILGGRS